MTYDQIVDAALERASLFGQHGGMARETLLRRIGLRQSQLFQRAAVLNPDFYGVCVVGPLSSGALDLEDLADPLNPVGVIERIEVAVAGTGVHPAGTTVNVVPLNDAASGLIPRVTVRDLVVRAVGTDLDGITSLRIYYGKLSKPILPTQGADVAQVRDPYSDLLVIDAARYILLFQQARGTDTSGGQAMLTAEEKALMEDYELHVNSIVLDPGDRFRRFGEAR